MEFPVVDVSSWENVGPEPVGREEKVWLRRPGAPPGSAVDDWLFKPVVVTADGNRQGEDWAEKIVAELGILLGAHDPRYIEGRRRLPGRPGHSPAAVLRALRDVGTPPGYSSPDAAAFFVGYLLLDAWVGNQDRHDENWAVLRRTSGPGGLALAASFDHASSLGFQRRDGFRVATLRNGLDRFVARARAHRFEHDPAAGRAAIPSLVDLARSTAGSVPGGRRWWDRLEAVRRTDVDRIVAGVSGLSEPTATFILEMLRLNRERLLDVR